VDRPDVADELGFIDGLILVLIDCLTRVGADCGAVRSEARSGRYAGQEVEVVTEVDHGFRARLLVQMARDGEVDVVEHAGVGK